MVAGRRKPPAKRAAAPTAAAAAPPAAPSGLPALRRLLRKAAGLSLVDTTEAGEYVSPVGAKARAGLLSCAAEVQAAFSQAHAGLSEQIDARRVLVQLCAVCLRWATEGVVCLWANRSYEESDPGVWAWGDCAACSETLAKLCCQALAHRLVRELRQMLVCRCAPNLYQKVRDTTSLCAPYAAGGLPAHARLEDELACILLPSGSLLQAPEDEPLAPPPAKRAKMSPKSKSAAPRCEAEAAAERLRLLTMPVLRDIGQRCGIPKRPRKEETVLALADEWRQVLPLLEAVEKGLPLPEVPPQSPAPSPAKDAGNDDDAAEGEGSCSDDDEAVTAPPPAKRPKPSQGKYTAPRSAAEAAERLRLLTMPVLRDIGQRCGIAKRPRKEETVLALADEWRQVLPLLEAVEKGLPLPEVPPPAPSPAKAVSGKEVAAESSCSDDDEVVTAPKRAKPSQRSKGAAPSSAVSAAPRSAAEAAERLRLLTMPVLRDIGQRCGIPKRPRKEETVLALADEWRQVLPFLEAVEKGLPLPEVPQSPAPSPAAAAASAVEEADKEAAAAAAIDAVQPDSEATNGEAEAGAGETRAESSGLPSPPPSLSPPRQPAAQGAAAETGLESPRLARTPADAGFSAWLSATADGNAPVADGSGDDSPDHVDGSHLPPLSEEVRVWEQAASAAAAAAAAVDLPVAPYPVAGATLTQLLQPRAGGSVVSGTSADESLWSAPVQPVVEDRAEAPEAPVVAPRSVVPFAAAGKEAVLQGDNSVGLAGVTEEKGEIDAYVEMSANVFASW